MTNEQEPLTCEKVIAQFALHYAIRLACNAPYAKLPAPRRKREEEAFVKIVMFLHGNSNSSIEWEIEYVHILYVSHLATFEGKCVSPKEQIRRDAYTAVYNLFCSLYPRREKVAAAAH